MKSLPFLFGAFLLFAITFESSAQYYNTGQDPSALKWLQIKTGRFNIIYPDTYGLEGIDFAKALDKAYSKLTQYFPDKKYTIPVIIHNHTTYSNGYVSWAPSRIEIYPTPEQNSIPIDPIAQLAIHELTHVMQMESLNNGFSKAVSVILGEQFPGMLSALLPLWYFEGDAVFAESALTGSGRGRSPSFLKRLKALTVEKGNVYKYDKMVNGSFKDLVPDHYELGYQLIAWSRLRYDANLWNDVLNLTSRMPFTLNPVNLSLRNKVSLTKKKLFTETFDTLKTIWESDYLHSNPESYHELNPPKEKEYINYLSPVYAEIDSVIAIKTSPFDPPAFVLIRPSEKTEKQILMPGNMYPWHISYSNGMVVWVETKSDPRWENRSWSVIKIYDINHNTIRQLSRKTRYLSASISPDGKSIAAVENTVDNNNNIVLIDASKGNIIKSIPSPDNLFLQRPQWDESGTRVSVIFLNEMGEGIMLFNITDGTWKTLIEAEKNDIQSSFFRNDTLFYISSATGTDNIWLRSPDKNVIQITKSKFGVSDLNISGSMILFSDYSASGNNICYTTMSDREPEKHYNSDKGTFLIDRIIADKEMLSHNSNEKKYTPVPYRKWQHLFRFHSWMPFYADLDEITFDPSSVKPGITLMSQNNLSTLISSIGYEYSGNRHKLHSKTEWMGWYLKFESRIDYGEEPVIKKFNGTGVKIDDPIKINPGIEITNRVTLPLFFSGGRFMQSFQLSGYSVHQNNYLYRSDQGIYDKWQNHFTGRLYLANYQRRAIRDINPKWAQVLDLSHTFSLFDKEFYGTISTARSAFYFPGIFSNNGVKFRIEIENQDPEKLIWNNKASFSRSYENIISRKLEFFSVDYYMPLLYPDFNISSFVYLTRIRGDLFYDLTRGTGNHYFSPADMSIEKIHNYTEKFESFGVELMTDFYLLRIPFQISAGLQAAWRDFNTAPYLKFLFNIDIFGMTINKKSL